MPVSEHSHCLKHFRKRQVVPSLDKRQEER